MENLVTDVSLEPKTKDFGVQVKNSAFIYLQHRALTISSSTQTPNLDTDDTYEAAVLRGGPLKPAKEPNKPSIVRFSLTSHVPESKPLTLSERFQKLHNNTDDNLPIFMYGRFFYFCLTFS